MNDIVDIGRKIAKRRKFLKLTQTQLSEISGVSLRGLKTIESGEGNPTLGQLIKVLQALGLNINIGTRC